MSMSPDVVERLWMAPSRQYIRDALDDRERDLREQIAREVDAMRENRAEWPMLTGMGAAVLVEVAERIRSGGPKS